MPSTATEDRISTRSSRQAIALRVGTTAAALAIWFWSQSLIGARALPVTGIGDWTHAATAFANHYLLTHTTSANALLIVSSAIIDLMGLFLLGRWLLQGQARPFLALLVVLGLRQVMQALVALPPPPNEIWRSPGFPSLLVTYGVSNDFFFSAHTAIAVLAATELVRYGKRRLLALAILLVAFEIATVLVLRAHYVMDVFTGLITGLYAAHLADRLSTRLNASRSPH